MISYRYDFSKDWFQFEAGDDHAAIQTVKKEACRRTDKKELLSNAVSDEKLQKIENGTWIYIR